MSSPAVDARVSRDPASSTFHPAWRNAARARGRRRRAARSGVQRLLHGLVSGARCRAACCVEGGGGGRRRGEGRGEGWGEGREDGVEGGGRGGGRRCEERGRRGGEGGGGEGGEGGGGRGGGEGGGGGSAELAERDRGHSGCDAIAPAASARSTCSWRTTALRRAAITTLLSLTAATGAGGASRNAASTMRKAPKVAAAVSAVLAPTSGRTFVTERGKPRAHGATTSARYAIGSARSTPSESTSV